jgi:alpha-tubulin suppressor-like RCC1 family protein
VSSGNSSVASLPPSLWFFPFHTLEEAERAMAVQLGKTHVLLSKPVYDYLEAIADLSLRRVDWMCVALQAQARMSIERGRFVAMRKGAMRLQAYLRGAEARRWWEVQVAALTNVQRMMRGVLARQLYKRETDAAAVVLKFARQCLHRAYWLRRRRIVLVIHARSRGYIKRTALYRKIWMVCVIQRAVRSWLPRNELFYARYFVFSCVMGWWRGLVWRREPSSRLLLVMLATRRQARARRREAGAQVREWWRCRCLPRLRHLEFRQNVVAAQSAVRMIKLRHWRQRWRRGVRVAQARVRGFPVRLRFTVLRLAAYTIQRHAIARLTRRRFLRLRQVVPKLQSLMRGGRSRIKQHRKAVERAVAEERRVVSKLQKTELIEMARLQSRLANRLRLASSVGVHDDFVQAPLDVVLNKDIRSSYSHGWLQTIDAATSAATAMSAKETAQHSEDGEWGEGESESGGHEGAAADVLAKMEGLDSALVQIAVGSQHTVVLCGNGSMLSFGHSTNPMHTPAAETNMLRTELRERALHGLAIDFEQVTLVAMGAHVHTTSPEERKVVHLSAGEFHTAALTAAGFVYTWGQGRRGQLGLGSRGGGGDDGASNAGGGAMRRASVGGAQGRGYSMTWNEKQRGFVRSTTCPKPQVVWLPPPSASKVAAAVNAAPQQEAAGSNVTRATAVCCGALHTVVVLEGGGVCAFGEGRALARGVFLGDGDSDVPQVLPFPLDGTDSAVSITCGGGFSLALTSSGGVYSWGSNQFGQLGLGDGNQRLMPCLVTGLCPQRTCTHTGRRAHHSGDGEEYYDDGCTGGPSNGDDDVRTVVCISAGRWHAAALTEGGGAFTWGSDENGQLGQGSGPRGARYPCPKPTRVPDAFFRGHNFITQVACGCSQTYLLSSHGLVFGAGRICSHECHTGHTPKAKGGKRASGGSDFDANAPSHALKLAAAGADAADVTYPTLIRSTFSEGSTAIASTTLGPVVEMRCDWSSSKSALHILRLHAPAQAGTPRARTPRSGRAQAGGGALGRAELGRCMRHLDKRQLQLLVRQLSLQPQLQLQLQPFHDETASPSGLRSPTKAGGHLAHATVAWERSVATVHAMKTADSRIGRSGARDTLPLHGVHYPETGTGTGVGVKQRVKAKAKARYGERLAVGRQRATQVIQRRMHKDAMRADRQVREGVMDMGAMLGHFRGAFDRTGQRVVQRVVQRRMRWPKTARSSVAAATARSPPPPAPHSPVFLARRIADNLRETRAVMTVRGGASGVPDGPRVRSAGGSPAGSYKRAPTHARKRTRTHAAVPPAPTSKLALTRTATKSDRMTDVTLAPTRTRTPSRARTPTTRTPGRPHMQTSTRMQTRSPARSSSRARRNRGDSRGGDGGDVSTSPTTTTIRSLADSWEGSKADADTENSGAWGAYNQGSDRDTTSSIGARKGSGSIGIRVRTPSGMHIFSKSRGTPNQEREQQQDSLKRRSKAQPQPVSAQPSKQRAQEIEKQLEHIVRGERYSI